MRARLFTLALEDLDDNIDEQVEDQESSTVVEEQPDSEEKSEEEIREIEYVYYFRLLDFKQLSKAVKAEIHEQWEVKIPKTDGNAAPGRLRARITTSSDGKKERTLTVKNKAKEGQFESETKINETFFQQFMLMSDAGMHKHRYYFPVEGTDLQWEIDVYPDGKSGYLAWGRAELEVKGKMENLPQLPITVEEVITPEQQQTNEGMEKVQWLFDNFFITPNPYVALNSEIHSDPEDEEDDADDSVEDSDDQTEQSEPSNDTDDSTEETTDGDKEASTDDDQSDDSES